MPTDISDNGLKMLEGFEGHSNTSYLDTRGLPTIGVGHLLTQNELSSGQINIKGTMVDYTNGLTDQQVEDLLDQDLQSFVQCINNNVTVPLNQNQFDALVLFCFNVGPGAFTGSTLLSELNNGNYADVPAQLMRWDKSGGVVVAGLERRREAEGNLWNTP